MLAIYLAILVCTAVANPTDGRAPRIIGGEVATDGQFPHQVSLKQRDTVQHFCGGSIIGKSWILTAAQCVSMLNPSEIIIVVGTNYIESGGESYDVDIIKKHEDYNPRANFNDIAVLHSSKAIILNSRVRIIPLSNLATPGGTDGIFSGWGSTSYPSNIPSEALNYIGLKTINLKECNAYLEGIFTVTTSHVCTILPSGKGLCKGDSGGPLIVNNVQHGISIWGVPCGKGYPDVFTSVSYHHDWIKAKTGV